ncbi:MAG: hypothetical protein MOP51_2190, partial [Citricoccus sp.]|nr:hypothetical protein [Citricoccus sp. WCRC_4]
MRLRLALASLPLAAAVALFAATGLRHDPASVSAEAPAAAEGTVAAGDSGMPRSGAADDLLAPVLPPGAAGATVPSVVAEAAQTDDV